MGTITEIWKDIRGYEGLYQVSNLGNFKSLNRKTPDKNGKIKTRKEMPLIPIKNITGYYYVALCKNCKYKRLLVHRLVMLNFIGENKDKLHVNHKNGIKSDNRLENLEWMTRSENDKHAYMIGLKNKKGSKHSNHKLIESDILVIFKMNNENIKIKEIANHFKVTSSTISFILTRKTWRHVKV